jgi:hypothetical protein
VSKAVRYGGRHVRNFAAVAVIIDEVEGRPLNVNFQDDVLRLHN